MESETGLKHSRIFNIFDLYPKRYPTKKPHSKPTRNGNIKLKLVTIVEGDPKAPFSIATTLRCRGGRYSFPRIDPLYPRSLLFNAEC